MNHPDNLHLIDDLQPAEVKDGLRFRNEERAMNFNDIPLLSISNTIQLVGVVYQGDGDTYVFLLPGESVGDTHRGRADCAVLEMSPEDWKVCLRQSDLCETEVLDGDKKAIVRKCERNVDSVLAWRVFKRDGFACQYCGRDDVPLTVDHLIRWEEGGPTIMENLLAVCKKCNRVRGNMPYEEWIVSEPYQKLIRMGNPRWEDVRRHERNLNLASTLGSIQKVKHVRSR